MFRGVERLANTCDVGRNAGCCFVMRREDRLDFVRGVFRENVGVLFERNTRAPLLVAKNDVEAHALSHVDPEQRELTEARHKNLVADSECIGDRGFPCARTRRRENENAPVLHFEDLLEIFKDRQSELRELRIAHVFHGQVHRHTNPVRDRRRAGNKEVRRNGHGVLSALRFSLISSPAVHSARLSIGMVVRSSSDRSQSRYKDKFNPLSFDQRPLSYNTRMGGKNGSGG